MRKPAALAIVYVGLLIVSASWRAASGSPDAGRPDPKVPSVEGTWEHTFADAPGHRQVKIINKTHFIWVTYERQTGRPLALGGGTCTSDGEKYRETFEFGSRGIPEQLIGKEQVLDVNIHGDEWTVTGTLTNGLRLNEKWRRVR